MDELDIINVTDEDELEVEGNEDEVNVVEDIIADDNVYVSDTVVDDLPDIIEAGQFYIYVPIASVNNKGIAQFNKEHFVVENGVVYIKLSPKAIADKNGEDIINTYQRKDNMIDQWISDLLDGKYPSAKLVKDSLDNIIYNKGKGVFVFRTQEDFLNWINGDLKTDLNGKVITDLVIGDDIFMLDGSLNYWCKNLSDHLTINDFASYSKSIWGSITGNIKEQADLIKLLNDIENEIPKTGQDIVLANDNKGTVTDAIINTNVRVDNIVKIIPSQVSETNPLADKDFVNSSIATNTAKYISNNGDVFTSELDLPLTNVDNNDYAFVKIVDALGNIIYNRYKYDGNKWAFEYALNNSSFTDIQWKAINSGINNKMVNKFILHLDKTLNLPDVAPEVIKVVGVNENNEQVFINADELGGGSKIIFKEWV